MLRKWVKSKISYKIGIGSFKRENKILLKKTREFCHNPNSEKIYNVDKVYGNLPHLMKQNCYKC